MLGTKIDLNAANLIKTLDTHINVLYIYNVAAEISAFQSVFALAQYSIISERRTAQFYRVMTNDRFIHLAYFCANVLLLLRYRNRLSTFVRSYKTTTQSLARVTHQSTPLLSPYPPAHNPMRRYAPATIYTSTLMPLIFCHKPVPYLPTLNGVGDTTISLGAAVPSLIGLLALSTALGFAVFGITAGTTT